MQSDDPVEPTSREKDSDAVAPDAEIRLQREASAVEARRERSEASLALEPVTSAPADVADADQAAREQEPSESGEGELEALARTFSTELEARRAVAGSSTVQSESSKSRLPAEPPAHIICLKLLATR